MDCKHFTENLLEVGVDEVARGTLAGPVYAAAVILPREIEEEPPYILRDSKKLNRVKRDALREYIEAKGGISVIPKRNYGQDIDKDKDSVDWCLYKYRHLVENAFARIKHYRSISTRYEKLARNYASMVSLAFSMMWLPMYC